MVSTTGMAFAAPGGSSPDHHTWNVLEKSYTPSGEGYLFDRNPVITDTQVSFELPATTGSYGTTARYLYDEYKTKDQISTFTVTFEVLFTGTNPIISNPNPLVHGYPQVRVEFQSSANGNYNFTDYWWYHGSVNLSALSNGVAVTITAPISDLSAWSDINGQSAAQEPAAFAYTLANIKEVSLSFGADNYYAGGVGVTPGTSATFVLLSFNIT